MRQGTLLLRLAPVAVILLCLAASSTGCSSDAGNPREARSGKWQGETSFGSFSFTVCQGGRRLEDYMMVYTTGSGTQALAPSGGDEVLVDKDGTFELSAPEANLFFQGQFGADGQSAWGTWEITIPGGDTLSEEWMVER